MTFYVIVIITFLMRLFMNKSIPTLQVSNDPQHPNISVMKVVLSIIESWMKYHSISANNCNIKKSITSNFFLR